MQLATPRRLGQRRARASWSRTSAARGESFDTRVLLAGFPVRLIPEIRRALDEAGQDTYNLDMVVCTDDMLDRNLSFVMAETPPIDWLSPAPEWTELNVSPTLLFTDNLHKVSQADVVEVVRSASNGWPVKFGDCSACGDLTVGEAIARVVTSHGQDVDELIVDYVDEEDDRCMEDVDLDDDDEYMMGGDVDGVDFSENLFLAIDDLTARAEELDTLRQ